MNDSQEALRLGAQSLARASAEARSWVRRLAPVATKVRAEERSLVEETRRTENLARRIGASAGRRSSVGVFGPSQAGKSFLVSSLGRAEDAPLMADFAGERRDFIRELNPAGGKESTGLVSRFTTAGGSQDRQHPVELRLLTETDLVKIIGNSFLADFDQNHRSLGLGGPGRLGEVIAQCEAQAQAEPASHLDEIAMYDIGEYFETHFRGSTEPLRQAGYWEALTRFGHRLPGAARIRLYSLVWGELPELTELFEQLHRSLEALGHAATARAPMASLTPREHSILDVEVLKTRLGTPQDASDLLDVVPESRLGTDGRAVRVPRATLCALVAEIKIVMADRPWPFFEHTDLLDFPGARARENLSRLPEDPTTRQLSVRNLFVRGKVAYLFQRYSEDRELTSMLLCIGPSVQEVKVLASLVGQWVEQTHGATPAARAALPCALFLVLTMLDKELSAREQDTRESLRGRMQTRVGASILELFGQQPWLLDWNGQPFSQTCFLRNPRFTDGSVFEHQASAAGQGPDAPPPRETQIKPAAIERLELIRAGLEASPVCARHIESPTEAWQAVMEPNDGGVRHLVQRLQGALSPTLKTRQLAGRLVERAQHLDHALRRFHVAEAQASRQTRQAELQQLQQRLYTACLDSVAPRLRRFAQLLGRLQVQESDVRRAFLDVASLSVQTPAPAAVGADADPWADNPWDSPPAVPATPATPATDTTRRSSDRYDHFAHRVLDVWTERVRKLANDAAALGALRLDAAAVVALADELVVAAHRLKLAERMADTVRMQLDSATARHEDEADRAAGIATAQVNDFVASLGFAGVAESARPLYGRPGDPARRPVFAVPPLPERDALPHLGATRRDLDRDHFVDWATSLMQVGLDNVGSRVGLEIGAEDNERLGEILDGFGPALRLMAPNPEGTAPR